MEIKKEIEVLVEESETMALQYQSYTVASNESLLLADGDLTKIKERIAELEKERLDITRPMDATKKKIKELFDKPINALSNARLQINKAMSTYRQEQEKIRQENERKLQEMAKKEEDRKKKALEERAKKAEESGKTDKADELRQKAEEIYIPVPIVESVVVDTKNKPRDVWKYRITNIALIPREYLIPDDLSLGQAARANKGKIPIPGVEVYREDSKF